MRQISSKEIDKRIQDSFNLIATVYSIDADQQEQLSEEQLVFLLENLGLLRQGNPNEEHIFKEFQSLITPNDR